MNANKIEHSSKRRTSALAGYAAGVLAGVTYGLNPLFAKPLLDMGVAVDTMLSIRYLLAVALLGLWMLLRGESLRVSAAQLLRLCALGVLFAMSSLTLFLSYSYIPAGLATTIVFLYPVLVALIMVTMKQYPSWQVWLSIFATFAGVVILSLPSGGVSLNMHGIALAAASALSYAFYLVVVNRSRKLSTVPGTVITFYALLIGCGVFFARAMITGDDFFHGVHGVYCWANLTGLAVFPTLVSLTALALSTRLIGATKTSVLGVFEPITAIVVGTVVFHEQLTSNVLIGIAITITAVIFLIVSEKSR